MKRVKIITSNAGLEEFLARTDIEIINVDVRSCEQSWFAQEYFTAAVYYDDEPKSEYNLDYWTRLEHQYAGMAMQSYVSNNVYLREIREMCKEPQEMRDLIADLSILLATTLVQKLKEKEE